VTGPGNGNYDRFIRDALEKDDSIWSVCSWHKNQRDYQTGDKPDEAGWGVYEQARKGGAIIATGHEHAYSRTFTMSHIQSKQVASNDPAQLTLAKDDPATTGVDEGRSFVFVSGLGGKDARVQRRGGAWWAKIHTANQGARPGALFGVFNKGGDPRLAEFYFKDINGRIVDTFQVRSGL
jgi:hypothetical protein